jgi:hypothetical protein
MPLMAGAGLRGVMERGGRGGGEAGELKLGPGISMLEDG